MPTYQESKEARQQGYDDFNGGYLPRSYDNKELDVDYQLGWNDAQADKEVFEHDRLFEFSN